MGGLNSAEMQRKISENNEKSNLDRLLSREETLKVLEVQSEEEYRELQEKYSTHLTENLTMRKILNFACNRPFRHEKNKRIVQHFGYRELSDAGRAIGRYRARKPSRGGRGKYVEKAPEYQMDPNVGQIPHNILAGHSYRITIDTALENLGVDDFSQHKFGLIRKLETGEVLLKPVHAPWMLLLPYDIYAKAYVDGSWLMGKEITDAMRKMQKYERFFTK